MADPVVYYLSLSIAATKYYTKEDKIYTISENSQILQNYIIDK